MAKVKKKQPGERYHFPLGKTNYTILIIGIIVLIVGYILMGIPDNPDDFLTRTLSPVLLFIAYLVIIPIGVFYKPKKSEKSKRS
jgi:membrane protein DedA with SNARE-associated domain